MSRSLFATAVPRFAAHLIGIAGCLALLSGCGLFGGDKKKPLVLPELSANAARTAWQASTAKSRGYAFHPAVSDGKVYVATHDAGVFVFDEASGRAVTRLDIKERLTAGVAAAQGLVAVVSEKGEVLTYGADGRLLWRAGVSGEVLAAPEIGPAAVVVRTTDGRVLAFNATDGKRRWVFTRATPSLTLRSGAAIVITRNEAVMGFPGGRVIALDQDTGKLLAEFNVATPRGASDLERVVDVVGTPYLEERRVCAVAFQGRVACFDPANGGLIWAKDASSSSGLAGDSKNLYVALDDGSVQALAKEAGASVWKNDRLLNRSLTQPLVVDKFVAVGDHLGFVHLLDPATGALVGRLATDGSAILSLAPLANSAVAQTAAGGVFALRF
jgi:outer membrane protein assembly factor BamB